MVAFFFSHYGGTDETMSKIPPRTNADRGFCISRSRQRILTVGDRRFFIETTVRISELKANSHNIVEFPHVARKSVSVKKLTPEFHHE